VGFLKLTLKKTAAKPKAAPTTNVRRTA